MTRFDVKTCPLCKKILRIDYDPYKDGYGIKAYSVRYYCLGSVPFDEPSLDGYHTVKSSYPHYEVIIRNGQATRRAVLSPYWLITEQGATETKVYSYPSQLDVDQNIIMKVSVIQLENITLEQIERLTKRMKNWVVFS